MEDTCCICGKIAEKNSIALGKKLFGIKSKTYCVNCLSKELGKDNAFIYDLIERYKKQGCPAFV